MNRRIIRVLIGSWILALAIAFCQDQKAAPPVIPTMTVNPGVLKPLVKIIPEYPFGVNRNGVNRRVVLKVLIGIDGKVENVEPKEGDPRLSQAAADAVKRWEYGPFTANNKPVRVSTLVVVNFK